jgi:hypothetical protein
VQEGLYLFNRNLDPYAGGFFHHVRFFCQTLTSLLRMTLVAVSAVPFDIFHDCANWKEERCCVMDVLRHAWSVGVGQYMESKSEGERGSKRRAGCSVVSVCSFTLP